MTGPFDEDLISAYYDGELPESEREAVTSRIADDAEAREVLDDFAELSRSLNSLPRSPAPTDLHGAVMRHVQVPATVRPRTATALPAGRRHWFWTAGTAASLLLAVGLFALLSDPHDDAGVELAQNMSDAEAASIAPTAPAESADRGGAGSGSGGGGFSPMTSLNETPAEAARFSMDAPPLQAQLQGLLQQFDEVEAGQQLHVLRTIGDELVLIEFQVVDVERAFGEVQVLLNELQITNLETEAELSDADALAGNRLRGILLDASHETLLAALDQIDQLESVMLMDTNGVDMALELGVEPDRIPWRMALEPSEGFAGADAEATAEADAAVPPAVPSGASREGAPQEAPGESGELLADAAQEEAPPLVEYQVPLSLSDAVVRDLEARQQQQSEQLDVSPPSDEDPGGREQRVPEEQRRADSYADRTRSRFLIIFVARDGSDGD